MKNKTANLVKRRNRAGYLFIAPFVIGLVAIFIPCLVESLIYSFYDVKLGGTAFAMEPIGWKNYYDLFFVNATFRQTVLDAVQGIFVDTLMITIFSFFVANVLNQKFIGRGVARAILFLPVILATGVISAVQNNDMSMGIFGNAAVGGITSSLGGEMMSLEDVILMIAGGLDTDIVDFIVTSVENTTEIINAAGVQILVFLAALQSIPQSVFEAAHVEGATGWQEFWKITFPMVMPMMLVNVVYTIVDTFTRPEYGILELVEQQAFEQNKMGMASAISWVFFVLMAVILAIVAGLISRGVSYTD